MAPEGVEIAYRDALSWYFDLVMAGNDTIGGFGEPEEFEFYELWRRDIKREMVMS